MSTDTGEWAVRDEGNGNVKHFDSRSEAEDARDDMDELGVDVTLVPPGGDTQTIDAEPVDTPTGPDHVEPVEPDPQPAATTADEAAQLPERNVAEDPLTWMPSDFVDEIDGTPAINRKGFEVLAHFYDVSVSAELQVAPEDTEHEYARVKATASTPDGRTAEAFGSAHTERGDDPELLLEMAGTRARKRAISIATGAGAVAVAELKEASHGE